MPIEFLGVAHGTGKVGGVGRWDFERGLVSTNKTVPAQ